MGLFYVKGFLAGPTGQQAEVEFLVDTGATLLVVPRPLAERLALTPTSSQGVVIAGGQREVWPIAEVQLTLDGQATTDRKSTRLNSSHSSISYAVFCLKK